jgi:hypothetical protein
MIDIRINLTEAIEDHLAMEELVADFKVEEDPEEFDWRKAQERTHTGQTKVV